LGAPIDFFTSLLVFDALTMVMLVSLFLVTGFTIRLFLLLSLAYSLSLLLL
jgi:hypothetical protein